MTNYTTALLQHLNTEVAEQLSFDEIDGRLSDFGLDDRDIEFILSCLDASCTDSVSGAQLESALKKAFPVESGPLESPGAASVPADLNGFPTANWAKLHRQSAQELHQQSAKELHQQSAQELHQQSAKELHQQSAQELHQQSAQELHQQSAKEVEEAPAKEEQQQEQPAKEEVEEEQPAKEEEQPAKEEEQPATQKRPSVIQGASPIRANKLAPLSTLSSPPPPPRANQLAPIRTASNRSSMIGPGPLLPAPALVVSPTTPGAVLEPPTKTPAEPPTKLLAEPPAKLPAEPPAELYERPCSALAIFAEIDAEGSECIKIEDVVQRLHDAGFEDPAIEAALFGLGPLHNGRVKKQEFLDCYPVLRTVGHSPLSSPIAAVAASPGPASAPAPVALEDTTGTLTFGSSRSQKNCYTESPASAFEIRDAKYLKDKKKYTPDAAMFDVVGFDVFNSEMERFTCLDWEDSVYRRAKRNAVAEGKACPRYLIVHFKCPGEPSKNAMMYFAEKPFTDTSEAGLRYKRLIDNFFDTDNDKFRKTRFKMIPLCVQGPWMVKKAMGAPALIGKKLDTYFNREPGCIEITIDVSSSMMARATFSTCAGASTALILDLGFTIEGKKEDELPERLLSGVRIQHLDLDAITYTR